MGKKSAGSGKTRITSFDAGSQDLGNAKLFRVYFEDQAGVRVGKSNYLRNIETRAYLRTSQQLEQSTGLRCVAEPLTGFPGD